MARQKELQNPRGTGRQKRGKNSERKTREREREREKEWGREETERCVKGKKERMELASRAGWASSSYRGLQELSPQPCRRQRWVAPEILTCQTPSALRGPNQN